MGFDLGSIILSFSGLIFLTLIILFILIFVNTQRIADCTCKSKLGGGSDQLHFKKGMQDNDSAKDFHDYGDDSLSCSKDLLAQCAKIGAKNCVNHCCKGRGGHIICEQIFHDHGDDSSSCSEGLLAKCATIGAAKNCVNNCCSSWQGKICELPVGD